MNKHEHLKTYLVGGAVRDQLLGLPHSELDWVVVGSSPEEMLDLGFRQVGRDFPVFLHPETREEYALARTERKKGAGYHGFATAVQNVSLEDDLERRDLTINAIAQTPEGELIDPYNGQGDLQNRLLRHVSPAFAEDPLRVLRVARFVAQLAEFGFGIADETLELLRNMVDTGELQALTPERVWIETEKALKTPRPRLYFETLRELGALAVIFPEVDKLFGVPQRREFHPEIDTGLHCMLSLDRIAELTPDPIQRFAVLCHDLGKAETPEDVQPRHPGHEQRSAELTHLLCDRLRVPNKYRNLAVRVANHHLICHQALRRNATEIVDLLTNLGSWSQESSVEAFANCCMADARGRTGLENRPYPQREFLLEAQRAGEAVSARELLAQGFQGPEIGRQMRRLRAEKIAPVLERYADIDELAYAKPGS